MAAPLAAWTTMRADPDPLCLGAAPAELVEVSLRFVRNMDRDALDLFVRHTWRRWNAASLRTLAAAVDTRRAHLDGE
ncbi:MAG TPA: hypothetical protein VL308_13030 [Gemmatimonadaceae bacterium]|jgi:hypothetical protein|nr:hypothetical protein [Gemmatimonadaceae bacterium]